LKALSKKEVGLGNALPWMVKGLKEHLKGGRVKKHTTLNAQELKGSLKKEVWLGNALP
jgi:hypothetical protein